MKNLTQCSTSFASQTKPLDFCWAFPDSHRNGCGGPKPGIGDGEQRCCKAAGLQRDMQNHQPLRILPLPRPDPDFFLHLDPSQSVFQALEKLQDFGSNFKGLTQELSDNKARPFLKYLLLLLCLFLSFCVFMHKYVHIYTPTCYTLRTPS